MAAAIAFVAGYVDAIGYLGLGGFFVSFMSGNTTRLGAGLAEHSGNAAIAIALIVSFVTGVTLGALIAARARREFAILFVAVLLAGAAVCGPSSYFVAGIGMASAMGAINSAFVRDGGLPVGLTYMTGTLVKIGHSLAAITQGGRPFAWVPYATHWAALVAGAIVGGMAYASVQLGALWMAVAAVSLMALAAFVSSAAGTVRK